MAAGERRSSPVPGAVFRASRLPPASGRLRILVVDDTPAVGRSLARLLAREHEVVLRESGVEARELLLGPEGRRFDVVLCDLKLPDLNGGELFTEVTEVRADMAPRFVFMTGGAHAPWAAELLARVPNACLHKPFEVTALRAVLATFAAAPR